MWLFISCLIFSVSFGLGQNEEFIDTPQLFDLLGKGQAKVIDFRSVDYQSNGNGN